jgi:hypothetical protein
MLLCTYFILNCGLHNFNLYTDAMWFNPLGSGLWYVHQQMAGIRFVGFYPIMTDSVSYECNLLFSPMKDNI